MIGKHEALLVQCCVYGFLLFKSFAIIKALNYLGKDYLLLISQSIVIVGLFTQLGFFNYEASLVKDIATDKKNSAFASMLFLLSITMTIIGVLTIVFDAEAMSFLWGVSGSEKYLYVLWVNIYVAMLNQLSFYIRQANGRFAEYSKVILSQQLIQLVVVILSVVFDCSAFILLVMLATSEALVFYIFNKMLFLDSYKKSQKNGMMEWIRLNFKMSTSLLLAGGFIWIIQNYGRFVFVDTTAEIMAMYIVSFTVASLPNVFIQPISNILYPEFCVSKSQDAVLKKWVLVTIVIIGMVALIDLFLSEIVVTLVSNESLYAGYEYFMYMGFGQLLFCLTRVFSLYFAATNHQQLSTYGYAIGAVLIVFLYRIDPSVTILESAKIFAAALVSVILIQYISFKKLNNAN